MAATGLTFTAEAYSLLVLHAARHPQATVTGLLLGALHPDGGAAGAKVEKVVPIGHHWTNLAAIEDVALSLIDAHLSNSPQLTLLGVYEAPARANATTASPAAVRLASKVFQQRLTSANSKGKARGATTESSNGGAASAASSGALVVVVQNTALLSDASASDGAMLPFTVATSPSSSGGGTSLAAAQPLGGSQGKDATNRPSLVSVEGGAATIKALTSLVRQQSAWQLVRDLDDHLEDTSIDWLQNSAATKAIKSSGVAA